VAVEPAGPGQAVARFAGASVTLDITRRAGEPFVRLDGRIDNARPDHRLRMWIGLDTAPATSTALVPFEITDRPLVGEGYLYETGSPTWPARGAVLAAGTAILAEGVVEYEVAGDRLGIALLRATGTISRETIPTRPIDAGPDVPTPDAQCLGETAFSLAIWQGATRDGLVEAWERFALPLLEGAAAGGGTGSAGSLLEIAGAHLSAVRRVPDGLEVRAWNDRPEPVTARIGGRVVGLGPAGIATVMLGEAAG
jgi:alpha-mannosidase